MRKLTKTLTVTIPAVCSIKSKIHFLHRAKYFMRIYLVTFPCLLWNLKVHLPCSQ